MTDDRVPVDRFDIFMILMQHRWAEKIIIRGRAELMCKCKTVIDSLPSHQADMLEGEFLRAGLTKPHHSLSGAGEND